MKYCSSIWFTDGRCVEPATDQTLLTNAPDRPFSGLDQHDNRGAKAELSLTEDLAGCCRKHHRRARTPYQLAGLRGREKERRVHVAKSVLAATVRS
jgi:hypothetical protein